MSCARSGDVSSMANHEDVAVSLAPLWPVGPDRMNWPLRIRETPAIKGDLP
jgi:hypothetical protein